MDDRPVRWALICMGEPGYAYAIRRIPEDRIKAWTELGWVVMGRDSDVFFEGLEDVRRDDERGRR